MKVWHQDHDEQHGIMGGFLREAWYALHSAITNRPVLRVRDQSHRKAAEEALGIVGADASRTTILTEHWGGVLRHTTSRSHPVTCEILSSNACDPVLQAQRDSLPPRSARINTALIKNLLQ